ncbi:MAG: Dockerin type domain [Cyanobacteria bacterium RYN_339]|nr:Dockerin type domain [Cyanobacteria bacterium RYN_339]
MGDDVLENLKHVSAKQIADAIEGKQTLDGAQLQAADVNHDGKIDVEDVEALAKRELELANKISGAIVGMEALTEEEKAVTDVNHDGHINLTDSYRLADDARAARGAAARMKRGGTGELKLPPT